MNTLDRDSLLTARSAPIDARAFAVQSARWLAAALAAIGLLWLLGLEAVLYRAAPLHARPDSILGDVRVLPTAALLMAAAALLIRRTALDLAAPVPRGVTLACTAAAVLIAAAWVTDPAPLEWVAFHALAIAVFTVGMGLLLNAASMIGLPAREPAPRAARSMVMGMALFAFVFAASIAMIRGGPEGLEALATQPPLAFTEDLDKVGSPYALFRDFTAMQPGLSEQARLHPPGALLLVWSAALLTAHAPLGIVLILMALAALAVIPLYGWVSAMASRRAALIAAMLYCAVPGVTLFASGSVEAAFAPFTLTALFAHARATRDECPQRERAAWGAAAGVLFALVSLMHFALLPLALWFVIAGILHAARGGPVSTLTRAWLGMALGFCAVHGLILATTGFDYTESFRLAWGSLHGATLDAPRASWYWWPVLTALALTFYAGVPTVLLAARAMRRLPPPARALARCGVIAFACLALAYLGTGEGERAAYHAYPFLVLPAALMLEDSARRQGSLALPAAAMGLCAVQAWIMQSYFQV